MRATSRLVLEGEGLSFGAVLTFFSDADDLARADERLAALAGELDPATHSFGEFRRVAEVRGRVLGAIRVDVPFPGNPALLGVGRLDPPPPVPGQQTLFLARLRGDDGVEALVHVASAPPRDTWPGAEFLGRAVVSHVDRGESMP